MSSTRPVVVGCGSCALIKSEWFVVQSLDRSSLFLLMILEELFEGLCFVLATLQLSRLAVLQRSLLIHRGKEEPEQEGSNCECV